VASTDGSTYAVDAATGRLEWRSVPPVAGPSYTDLATGSLRWTRRGATVLGEDPRLTVLRTEAGLLGVGTRTGAARWERRPVLVADDTAVALTSTTVVVPGTAAGTLGLDPRTGRTRWRAQAAFSAVASGDVVVTTGSAGVSGLDGRTGAVRWRRAARRGVVAVAVAPGGRVLMLDSDPVPRMGA
jgi:outer membrane protein assembly factor BamB